jgi:hypothetical protein
VRDTSRLVRGKSRLITCPSRFVRGKYLKETSRARLIICRFWLIIREFFRVQRINLRRIAN